MTSVSPISDRELIHLAAETCDRKARLLVVPQTALRLAAKIFNRIPTWHATIPSLSRSRSRRSESQLRVPASPLRSSYGTSYAATQASNSSCQRRSKNGL